MNSPVVRPAARKTLEILADSDLWLTPNNIARNAGYKAGTIRNEIPGLLDEDLIESDKQPGDPFYRITDDGRAYLAGELDASELGEED